MWGKKWQGDWSAHRLSGQSLMRQQGGIWEYHWSIFCLQSVWGLCVGDQHAVSIFPLVGVMSEKLLKDMAIAPEEELKVLDLASWLIHFYYFVLFDCFSLFFPLLWLNLVFGTWGSSKRLRLFEVRDMDGGWFLSPERLHVVQLGFMHTKQEIRVWFNQDNIKLKMLFHNF